MKTKQCCFCGSNEHNAATCSWNESCHVCSRVSGNHVGWEVQERLRSGWKTYPEGSLPLTFKKTAKAFLEALESEPEYEYREFRVYEVLSSRVLA